MEMGRLISDFSLLLNIGGWSRVAGDRDIWRRTVEEEEEKEEEEGGGWREEGGEEGGGGDTIFRKVRNNSPSDAVLKPWILKRTFILTVFVWIEPLHVSVHVKRLATKPANSGFT